MSSRQVGNSFGNDAFVMEGTIAKTVLKNSRAAQEAVQSQFPGKAHAAMHLNDFVAD
jgi:hypothetical protein